MTVIHSFMQGTPVITSNLGVMSAMLEHGRTGLHFGPGDPEELAVQVYWLFEYPAELERMRREARKEYEKKYTADRNYEMLMEIYERVVGSAKKAAG
jgi:glycosyltransferase involved in cell wall biosynthesis